jgi:hypothetical protein
MPRSQQHAPGKGIAHAIVQAIFHFLCLISFARKFKSAARSTDAAESLDRDS